MKLYALDQVSLTDVQADTIKPGQQIDVSDARGKELLDKMPNTFSKEPPKQKAEAASANKAAPAPQNKMAQPPANKSIK